MPDDLNDLPYIPDYEESVDAHLREKSAQSDQADKDIKASENAE